jgi:hypothetical protein
MTLVCFGAGERSGPDSARAIHAVSQITTHSPSQ